MGARSTGLLAGAAIGAVMALAAPAAASAAERVQPESFRALPPASQVDVSPEARALRARLLGPRANDPGYVTLHWVGVSSFVVTIRGHLFLFDAWEVVGANMDYVPIGREELAGLEPEAVAIGHGHFDHAADAGYVVARTGAPVLASEEQCATIEEDAEREGDAAGFTCVLTGTQDAPAPGTLSTVRLFDDLPPVTILKNVHSSAEPPSEGNQLGPFAPVFDPTPYLQNPNTSPEELARFAETLGDPEGGTRMYHLRAGDFTLLLGDSAGPLFENPEVRASLDALPGCVDVMANAILGFDQPVSGLQDPVAYVANAHPRVFVPTHADAWAPALSAGQAQYREQLAREVGELPDPPEIDHLLDPRDYLAERAYRIDDPRWSPPMPGSSCAQVAVEEDGGPVGPRRRGESRTRRDRGEREPDRTRRSPDAGGDRVRAADPSAGSGGGGLPFTGLGLGGLTLGGVALAGAGLALRARYRKHRPSPR